MTVYLIPNLTKPQAAPTAAAAVDVLCAQGCEGHPSRRCAAGAPLPDGRFLF